MLTPEQIAALRDAAGQVADPIANHLIADIARRIAGAGQLTSTAAYQIYRTQQIGISRRMIKKRLRDELGVGRRMLRELLTQSAEVGYDFDIKNFPGRAVPFKKNPAIQQMVSAAVKLAEDDFTNITQTLGMVDPFGNALPLQDAYRKSMDYAFEQVFTGAADYQTAIRRVTANLDKYGLRTIDYESGIHTSLEAAVRRNIMGGLGLMQEQISQHNHDTMGADGWEISAHANSAPDHEPIQGKQYSDAEYQALNEGLQRRIGTLNCGHAAFPIILGVSSPQYSEEQLEAFQRDNEYGITYQGKHYSGYEATQMQRKLERAIRSQKRRILIDEETGDKDKLLTDQIKLTRLNDEYMRFSKATGLPTQRERAEVAGFGRGQAARSRAANARVEKLANSMYDIGSTKENVSAYLRDLPLRKQLQSDSTVKAIIPGQQKKHIPGTLEYNQYVEKLTRDGRFGPSRLSITLDDAQVLVDKYRGTGVLPRGKDGYWLNQEWITLHSEEVGVAVNDRTGAQAMTTVFKIHYGKNGTHVVPDYPSRKGMKGPK